MFEDDLELVEHIGLSAELTENSNVNTVISNVQYEDYRVSIHICPPVERDDVKYFMIYNVYWPRGEDIYAMKCARISLFEPKYIECIDSTIPNWVLNKDEKKTILKEISRIWRRILYQYEFVLYGFDNKIVKLQGLPMPNYMLLPE